MNSIQNYSNLAGFKKPRERIGRQAVVRILFAYPSAAPGAMAPRNKSST